VTAPILRQAAEAAAAEKAGGAATQVLVQNRRIEFPIVEIFGPTIQGEGQLAGVRTHFIRTAYCDNRCAFCDTLYAVIPSEAQKNSHLMSVLDILTALLNLQEQAAPTQWVTITGGNPLLWDLQDLIEALHISGFKVSVETQGTAFYPWLRMVDQCTISPKPPSAGPVSDSGFSERRLTEFLANLYGDDEGEQAPPQVSLKIPIADRDDLAFAYGIKTHPTFGALPLYLSVCNLSPDKPGAPSQETAAEQRHRLLHAYNWLIEAVNADPVKRWGDTRVLPQLHVLLWGNRKGV
jgi:7-carboxy-7-deazaguanine synthase